MTIGIIGLGRFGNLLSEILSRRFQIRGFDEDDDFTPLKDCETVFVCVPIRHFEEAINACAPYLKPNATVIDTCSVKCHPVKIMQQSLPDTMTLIATHPLFGPDSYFEASTNQIMTYFVQGNQSRYSAWLSSFEALGLTTLEMTPETHDKDAAYSQGITHCLGRILDQMGIESTPIDTLGFTRLLGIKSQTCNDTSTLFEDLMQYNPYSRAMLKTLYQAVSDVYASLAR